MTFRRVEINGRAAGVEDLSYAAMVNYGHFTVMQVRAGKVRGLKLHLHRLDTATQELFGTNLDRALVREYLRHALRDTLDASVRISIFSRSENADPLVMVTVRAPMNTANTPRRLMTVRYRRELPHIKHVGTFGQIYYARLAEQHGFDDALFVGTDGNISETTIANIGFFEGDTIVWPDSPALEGITMQLVEKSLAGCRVISLRRRVKLDEIGSFDGAFLTNSSGIVPVGQIDDQTFPAPAAKMKKLLDAYESVPWDPL